MAGIGARDPATAVWKDPIGWWCSLGRPLAHLPRIWAIALLAGLIAALAWSSIATSQLAQADTARVEAKAEESLGDLELYARIHQRVQDGEAYYAAAMDEQRQNNYPTRPFVTVRLPTLAFLDGLAGETVWRGLAIALLAGIILAWQGALAPHTVLLERSGAALCLFLAGIGMFDARAMQFHELVSGALLALALGAYRQNRWWPALIVAVLALSIRELALPFLLLWGAFSLLEKRWKESAAIGAVLVLFVIAMFLHAQGVEAQRLADDPASPGWDGFNGPQMALFSLSQLTALTMLPIYLAAPIALLPLLGWAALGGRLGLFATLWFAGFGLAVALFARTNNFYWVLIVLPAYAAGLAFVPRAVAELLQGAAGKLNMQS